MSSPRSSKRRRIYRACDQCRRRKSKCDGEQPVCAICRSAGRNCSYETGGGRRGLAPGYVRSLEVVLGLTIQKLPNSEATINGILRESRGKGDFLSSKLANRSLNAWRRSKLSRDVSNLLSTDSGDPNGDGEWEPEELPDQDDNDQPSDHEPIQDHNETLAVPNLAPHSTQPRGLLDVPYPDCTSDLLDFYFTYTHCWFPVLERRELLRAMHVGPSHSTSQIDASCILLWSVITYSSILKGFHVPGLPSLTTIELFLQQQVLAGWGNIEVAHIQAILILSLIHIATGNIHTAWLLAGQASRVLAASPTSFCTARFHHTFNGCTMLDNILSATLGRTPCLAQEELQEHGNVNEDDVEEWDIWPASRTGASNARKPEPLRALSTFNAMRQLMNHITQLLYNNIDASNFESALEAQQLIIQHHPYDKHQNGAPPLLILHLTSSFAILTLIRRYRLNDPTIADLCLSTVAHSLDLLDQYFEIIGGAGPSPLVYCFAVQCQYCIENTLSTIDAAEKAGFEARITQYRNSLQLGISPVNARHMEQSILAISRSQGILSPAEAPVPSLQDLQMVDLVSSSQVDSLPTDLPGLTAASQAGVSTGGSVEIEGYDDLFEEMVTSFPSNRHEPIFAHNLGFYDGDLDTDFLAHLQHPSAS